ncbi:hypothetical protein RN001_014852 [Aquatica leii]|uniref:Peptidase S1 domain-containing protein n=1 Tax=Aquatica leii TaxID=1421715 RepID=A0AAN7QC41_9COLE|nr:hypothetical protein RN001_014852 [Aquatica leii]
MHNAFNLAETLANPSNKIIGGFAATEGQFPHQVSIRKVTNVHLCGGSIISPNWVLTAASCTTGADNIVVIVGTIYLSSTGRIHTVSERIRHEAFDMNTKQNDIALLRLLTSIFFSDYVKSIRLANAEPYDYADCQIAGWGVKTNPPAAYPNQLQYTNTLKFPLGTCMGLLFGRPVFSTNLCTMQEYVEGTCDGDAGGALICNNEQVGISSWQGSCETVLPSVYTNVASYRSWIREHSGI